MNIVCRECRNSLPVRAFAPRQHEFDRQICKTCLDRILGQYDTPAKYGQQFSIRLTVKAMMELQRRARIPMPERDWRDLAGEILEKELGGGED